MKTVMRLPGALLLWLCFSISNASFAQLRDKQPVLKLTKDVLRDKIKGGWAGQTIGVTFGWPTEFVYQGTFIQDYQPIQWHDDYVAEAMRVFPGLFDDIYMDLTFVEVFERLGLEAPADSFALAYARSGYELWHANQAGRYNVLQGMRPPQSGHWLHNPHADDIDFQIEADFAGLMSPAMPNAASAIADKVGHIMNYGDGWYGGVFVANLYAQAFRSNDVKVVVNKALKAIPARSQFYQCVADVIKWHKAYPNDWKRTWFEIQRKWTEDVGCPDGVFHPLDIDAKLNSAYVVLGLLYGGGDFTKTMEISTRAGQDSDCNPSTAGGVLGTMLGYSHIPDYWLNPLSKAEQTNFSYTSLSLSKVYELGYRHALANITRQGGKVLENTVEIRQEPVKTVAFEESFAGHFPDHKQTVNQVSSTGIEFTASGIGFVLRGHVRKTKREAPDTPVRAALYVDGKLLEEASLPVVNAHRRTELFWRYQLPEGTHQVQIKILNPDPVYEMVATEAVMYSSKKPLGVRK
ncbi:ADP-ribosylglycohydrolase [Larkinella arboricola]|uniref:ADP-ribosylglycohydrolase n=1 Tax=Larkinella arboricola TaxID=643671 RepID=A0A327WPP6_LARAB|nr:ADP-ribosylglycohydrolase family protein [Larkinella arboricola]RAJ93198.1 ADP-ribosylglycohydrolase [Larkinella arboricola]